VVTELRDEESALLFHSDLSRITATFNEMKVSGSAGCNVYSAIYNETRDKRTISAPISTLMYCDLGVMESEAQYLKNLEKVTLYKIIGNNLLYEITGDTLFFKDAVGESLAEWKVYQSD
jgi:heat shock protein HslJ